MEVNAIELVQNPILKHKITEIGKSVTERLNGLNLEAQIVNEDSIQAIKKLRAELNNENKEYNNQYKSVHDLYMSPLNVIKELYKTEITDKFAKTDSLLKDKIGSFEIQIKEAKKNNIIAYFNELCISENIDFVKFETVVPEINLSTTEKKYKEQCNAFITKVVDDLKLISTTEFQAEILTEYKRTLNCSNSITTVTERKANEKKEADRIKALEKLRRVNELKKIGFVFMDITNSYEFDCDIYIPMSEIDSLETNDFNKKLIELDVLISDKKKKELEAKKVEVIEPKTEHTTEIQNKEIVKQIEETKKVVEPITAPVEVIVEKQLIATFEVTATRSQLLKLSEYLKSNNLTYKNL